MHVFCCSYHSSSIKRGHVPNRMFGRDSEYVIPLDVLKDLERLKI